MIRSINILLIAGFLLVFQAITATTSEKLEYQFNNINVNDGLSYNMVNCIYKDAKGFMWFGTSNGLNRYDANEFIVWKHSPMEEGSLTDNRITCINEDVWGNLWVGTRNGINKYFPVKDNFYSDYKCNKRNIQVSEIFIDEKNVMYLGTDKGLYVFNDDQQEFLKVPLKGNYENLSVLCIAQNSKNRLWLGTYGNGLLNLDLNSGNCERVVFNDYSIETVNDLLISGQDLIICTKHTGLLIYDIKTGEVAKKLEGFCKEVAKDNFGNYWVSNEHDLFLLGHNFEFLKKFIYTPNNESGKSLGSITDIYCDSLNNIWMSTGVSGIDVVSVKKNSIYDNYYQTGIKKSNEGYVKSFFIDSSERLWVGTFGNGIWIYDVNLKFLHRINKDNSKLRSDFISVIKQDTEKHFWVGSLEGLYTIDPDNFQVTKQITVQEGLYHDNIIDVIEDGTGSVWIATQEGLNILDKNSDKISKVTEKQGLIHYKINKLYKDSFQNIWIGTNKGISIYSLNNGSFTNFGKVSKNKTGVSDIKINDFCMDRRGNMWIGTNNGLNKYDYGEKIFSVYLEKDGLTYNIIENLHLDPFGDIWLHYPTGIAKMTPEPFSVNSFDGPEKWKMNINSLMDKKGKLYVGDLNAGFYVFRSDSLDNKSVDVPIYITGIAVNTAKYYTPPDNREIEIPYYENSIKFKFASLHYNTSKKTTFAYVLEGFDQEWKYTSSQNREIVYNNLKPGNYRFVVTDANKIHDKGHSDSFVLTVLPPWWRTWQSYTGFVFIFLITVAFINHIRKRRDFLVNSLKLAKEQSKLEHEANELKLKYFTDISHEIRTPLSLISVPIDTVLSNKNMEQNDQEKLLLAKQNIKRLQELINQLLDYRKITKGKMQLAEKQVEIVGYMKSILNVFIPYFEQHGISFSFLTDKKEYFCKIDTSILDKITYNLLSNALKHTPKNGLITLSISLEGKFNTEKSSRGTSSIQIHVKNTGKGIEGRYLDKIFDRFYQMPALDNDNHRGSGIGLSLTKEYVELMNGEIKVESIPDQSTDFYVIIPVDILHPNEINAASINFKSDMEPFEEELVVTEIKTDEIISQLEEKGDKVVLIVEDNQQLRKVIAGLMPVHFKIIEAGNGKTGLVKAEQSIPDIIISDVMMPEMNGYEFCRQCKKQELTSHIPILLLTAKVDVESRMLGYQSGADAFISKPFDPGLLQVRVENLLSTREILRKRYAGTQVVDLGDNAVSSADLVFLGRINKIIDKHLPDDEFNVHYLANEMHIGERQLHRKFLGFINKTPGEYIRTYKLNVAAQRLTSDPSVSVSEVGYSIGYKQMSHFSKAFKKQFGTSPSEYIKSK
jgi:ligand-binding sensor domain-containing protein/signal transduction histidine kinase/DNA-binding response OmpR family regulator